MGSLKAPEAREERGVRWRYREKDRWCRRLHSSEEHGRRGVVSTGSQLGWAMGRIQT